MDTILTASQDLRLELGLGLGIIFVEVFMHLYELKHDFAELDAA